MNIVMVESDQTTAELATKLFLQSGHDVQWSQSAQAGIDCIDTKTPDIIILEVQLGLHNGVEFLYELRSYLEWQNIPVVIYTSNQNLLQLDFRHALRQLGVRTVLDKSRITLEQLCRAVENSLEPVQ